MEKLIAAAKIALANTFVMYAKSHIYHWNVEGPSFNDYHAFFGTIYTELWAAVDALAEHMRVVDAYAPFSIEDLYSAKSVSEDAARASTPPQMFANLVTANDQVIASLNVLYNAAKEAGKEGFAQFVAERLDVHAKHGWMIKSHLKSV